MTSLLIFMGRVYEDLSFFTACFLIILPLIVTRFCASHILNSIVIGASARGGSFSVAPTES